MKFGFEIEGPGPKGIYERAYFRSGIASEFRPKNERHGTVICDTVFQEYADTEALRKQLAIELLQQGAISIEVVILDESVAPGRVLTKDAYITALLQALSQAEADVEMLKSVRV